MRSIRIKSDQYKEWSDYREQKIIPGVKKQESCSSKAASESSAHHTWFYYRTLQTLWQSQLQVRERAGPWSKILFVHQSIWLKSAYGLCTSRLYRSSRRVFRKFSSGNRDFRRDLSNQSRTFTTPRRPLINVRINYTKTSIRRNRKAGCFICKYARDGPFCLLF